MMGKVRENRELNIFFSFLTKHTTYTEYTQSNTFQLWQLLVPFGLGVSRDYVYIFADMYVCQMHIVTCIKGFILCETNCKNSRNHFRRQKTKKTPATNVSVFCIDNDFEYWICVRIGFC